MAWFLFGGDVHLARGVTRVALRMGECVDAARRVLRFTRGRLGCDDERAVGPRYDPAASR